MEMAGARCASCGQPLAAGEPRHPLGQAGEVEFACALCVGEHDPEAWAAGWESGRKGAAHRAGREAFRRKQAREQAAFVASWAGLAVSLSVPKAADQRPELDEPGCRCGLRHADLEPAPPIHLPFPIEELDAESFAAGLRDGRRRK